MKSAMKYLEAKNEKSFESKRISYEKRKEIA